MNSTILFKELTENAQKFFSILPEDWQEGIVPFWEVYQNTSQVYVLEKENEIIGGGILFTQVTPDMMAYKEIAQKYYEKGAFYLGFIWVPEKLRGEGLGKLWLEKIIEKMPHQAFWLTIEDYNLHLFYEKLNFYITEELKTGEDSEWILQRD